MSFETIFNGIKFSFETENAMNEFLEAVAAEEAGHVEFVKCHDAYLSAKNELTNCARQQRDALWSVLAAASKAKTDDPFLMKLFKEHYLDQHSHVDTMVKLGMEG